MAGAANQSPGNCQCVAACEICTTVTSRCGGVGTPLAGATITVTQSGVTIGTCITDALGRCCVSVPASGTYNVAASKTGYTGSNKNVAVVCPATVNTALVLNTTGLGLRFKVFGCNGLGLPGASVTIDGGDYTTDSTGVVTFSAGPGTYSWTVSATRFTGASGSSVYGSCNSQQSTTLTVAAGYHCANNGCAYPATDALTLSDSVIGTLTVNWSAGTVWEGFITYNFPGYCGCAAAANVSVRFQVTGNGVNGWTLTVATKLVSFCPVGTAPPSYSAVTTGSLPNAPCQPGLFASGSIATCICGTTCVGTSTDKLYSGATVSWTLTE